MKSSSLQIKIPATEDHLKLFVIALAYFGAHLVSFIFPDAQKVLMAVWPAGGIGLSVLLLNPRRLWPAILITLFISGNAANLFAHRNFLDSLGFMLSNCVESYGCAWLMTRICGENIKFNRVKDVMALIAAACLVNAFSACIGAGIVSISMGYPLGQSWLNWWIIDGLGIFIVTPFIIVWSDYRFQPATIRWEGLCERGAFGLLWVIVSLIPFYDGPLSYQLHIFPYMLISLLAWPAMRMGPRGVSTSIIFLAVSLILSPGVIKGPLRFGGETLEERLLLVQIYLGFMAVSGMLLAASYAERRQAEEKIKYSQNLLQRIIDLLPIRIFWKDKELKYLGCNEICAQGAGYDKPEDMIGKDDFQMSWKAHADIYRADDRAVISSGRSKLNYEEPQITAKGEKLCVKTSKVPLTDTAGHLLGVLGTVEDITERKKAEQQREEAMAYAQNLLTASPIGIITYKANGQAVSANEAAAALVGSTLDKVKNQNFYELNSWKESGMLDVAEKALTTGQEQIFEGHTVSSFGHKFWLSCRFVPFKFADEAHLMLLASDISERKLAEKKIRELNEGLEKRVNERTQEVTIQNIKLQEMFLELTHMSRVSVLGQLSAAMAHEINQPLGTILNKASSAQLILSRPDPDITKVQKILSQIIEEDERAGNVVRKLRELVKKESVEREKLDLALVIRDVVKLIKIRFIIKDISLELDIDSADKMVLGSKIQLQQVLLNLLTNALQALNDMPVKKIVVKSEVQQQGWIKVSVTNSGPPIDFDRAEDIFKPFYTTKKEGLGMGLFICRLIIHAHGGQLSVYNNPDQSVTFFFTIPAYGMAAEGENDIV